MTATDARPVVATCRLCGTDLHEGDTAYEEDWKTIDTAGDTAAVRLVRKYVCGPCNDTTEEST